MAAAYTAAPATAPTPIPTEVPLTGEELPESPPMGAPSPAEDVVEEDWSFVPLDPVLPVVEPYKMGIDGFTMEIRNLVDASGLS